MVFGNKHAVESLISRDNWTETIDAFELGCFETLEVVLDRHFDDVHRVGGLQIQLLSDLGID